MMYNLNHRHIFFSWIIYPYSEALPKRKVDLFRPSVGSSITVQIRIIKNPNILFINILGNFIVESEGIEPSSKHAIKERSTSLVFV